jgi:UDPglucose 6-dehydrogenase
MDLEKISVIGLGRVGLILAVSLAKYGFDVVGIDVDPDLVRKVSRGEAPFYEPNLTEYLSTLTRDKKFIATQEYAISSHSDLVYITVGTPSRADGSIDLRYVDEASKNIGRSLRDARQYQLVVVKSTVPPGTARNVVKTKLEHESGKIAGADFSVCSNPEFLREGTAIQDTESPDRIIIGSDDPSAVAMLENFYRKFHGNRLPTILKTTFENAELSKYANNAFLAAKISFINSIADIAQRTPHADVKAVAEGIGLDERIGPKFLNAGLGWGGSCFPKDLAALLDFGHSRGGNTELIEAVIDANKRQPDKGTELARQALGSIGGRNVSVLGLAFKPGTDDMRDAVSVRVINDLLEQGAEVTVWDPQAISEARKFFGDRIKYANNAAKSLEGADCCVLVTEWPEFKRLRPETFLEKMREPIVVDGRRVFDPAEFRRAGIRFYAIGLGPEA